MPWFTNSKTRASLLVQKRCQHSFERVRTNVAIKVWKLEDRSRTNTERIDASLPLYSNIEWNLEPTSYLKIAKQWINVTSILSSSYHFFAELGNDAWCTVALAHFMTIFSLWNLLSHSIHGWIHLKRDCTAELGNHKSEASWNAWSQIKRRPEICADPNLTCKRLHKDQSCPDVCF